MKKIDYYAQPEPWKVPKWMGVTLGTIFAAVAMMAVMLIVQLTRPAHAETQPPVVATVEPAPAAAEPVVTEPPVQPAAAKAVRTSAPHLRMGKKAKPVRTFATGKAKSKAILARHDSREKRKQKDDLDRLLGL